MATDFDAEFLLRINKLRKSGTRESVLAQMGKHWRSIGSKEDLNIKEIKMKPYTIEIDPEEVLDSYSSTEIIQYMNDNSALDSDDLSNIMRGFLDQEIVEALMDDRYVHDPLEIYSMLSKKLKEEGLI